MRLNTATVCLLVGFSAMGIAAAAETQPVQGSMPEFLFATVNGKPISRQDYDTAYISHVRSKFYHREGIADERLQAARKDVADQMIERILMLEEVERRNIQADQKAIDEAIANYEKRYASSPMWLQNREKMLPGLRQRLVEQNRLELLEKSVRVLPPPTEEEIRSFYEQNKSLFTEPEKLRLHTILLRIDPTSPPATWDAAREEATKIVTRLRNGAEFEQLARIHSQDSSAASGGDMGYLHLGMMPEALQSRIDKIGLGTISDPIEVLEGVAIFRLDERVPPKLRPFEEVKERARDLLARDREKKAWEDFRQGLRGAADVKFAEQQPNSASR
jgi:parvulin-like peptidyl-prolyl isomerase